VTFDLPDCDLELLVLGDFWRTLKFGIDRMAPDILALTRKQGLNWATGRPESANDLLAPGQIQFRNEKLLRHSYLCPWDLAAIHIQRSCDTCSECTSGNTARCESGPRLKYIPSREWTAEEAQDHAELEQRIQNLFRRWSKPPFSFIDRKPPLVLRPEDEQMKEEDDVWACRITQRGIEKCVSVFQGPTPPRFQNGGPWSNPTDNRRSPLWCMTDVQRRNAPQWLQKEFTDEGGKISGPPVLVTPLATLCKACDMFHPVSDCCPARPLVFPEPIRASPETLRAKRGTWLEWLKGRRKK